MRPTKNTGKVITLVVLVIALLLYLLPNITMLEQSLEIRTTPDKIFELINQPNRWPEWYAPLRKPVAMQVRYSGVHEGKGAQMQWTENNSSEGGAVNIRNSRKNKRVATVVSLNNHYSAIMTFKVKPIRSDASLLTISSRLSFPQDSMMHYLRMMLDRTKSLEIIESIENIGEAAIKVNAGIAVEMQWVESFPYLSITDTCAWKDMPVRMSERYKSLTDFAAKSELTLNRPIAIYHQLGEHQVIYETGITANEHIFPAGHIQMKVMPARNCVTADYYGAYDALENGHNAIQQWLTLHRRQVNGSPWEMYLTDPATEPDVSKWLTRIFYPVD